MNLTALARKNQSSIWAAMDALRRAAGHGQGTFEEHDPRFKAISQDKGRLEIDDFIALIEGFREDILGRKAPLSQNVRALVDKIDYWSYLVTEHSKNDKVARWKFLNIENLIQSITDWERNPDTPDNGLYAYLNRISLITSSDDGPGEEAGLGKVNLMTIHAAKGLEFPVVFIAGAEDGIIPHRRSIEEGGDIEEERRLFYVAITRARDKLYITSCLQRRKMQGAEECSPSPFLAEIPSHLIEYHEGEKKVENDEAEDYFALIKSKFA
jgi:DNA helicase-2/ATP-dependent DNA helicase PcrA